eukprot:1038044-Prymnesium_polylepis.1
MYGPRSPNFAACSVGLTSPFTRPLRKFGTTHRGSTARARPPNASAVLRIAAALPRSTARADTCAFWTAERAQLVACI